MLKSLILSAALKEFQEGVKKADANDYKAALPHFDKAIETYPEHPVFLKSRSECLSKLGKHNEALKDAKEAVKLDDTSLEGYITLAKCCLNLGDLIASKLAVTKALELDPSDKTAAKYRRACASLQGYEEKYRAAIAKEDYEEGFFYMERALVYSPNCVRYKNNKAESLAYLGRYQESLNLTNAILAHNPGEVDAVYNKALCNYYQEKFTVALEILNLLFKLTNEHKRAKDLRNRTKRILEIKETGWKAHEEKKYYQALYLFEQALKIDPKLVSYNTAMHCNCAAVLMEQRKFKEASEACAKALALDKRSAKALICKGKCQEALKDWPSALTDYRAACEIEDCETTWNAIKAAKDAFKKVRYYYYRLLEVSRYASENDIKKAFRKQSLVYHPDKHQNKSKKRIIESEEYFKEITNAYTVLSDRTKRMRYDLKQLRL